MLKLSIKFFTLLSLILSSHLIFAGSFSKQGLTKLSKPIAAPNFMLMDMEGEKHQLSDYKGKTVIVNFWATWCPPCRAEMPSMERAWQKIKDQGIAMLAINVGEDEDTIFTFLGDYPANFTVLLDQNSKVSELWPLRGLPTTFIVDPKGKIIYRAIGGREWDDDKLLNMIKQLNH
jgi:peroxiredoxin